MSTPFTVTVGEFEGPLDLLLTLIEERKMLVSDVSLASVTDNFIAYVRTQRAFPASATAEFLLVAATLLLLKSKALLPIFSLTEDEVGDAKDLEHRLNLYQAFRGIARTLGTLSVSRLYFGGMKRDTTPIFSPASDMSIATLTAAAHSILMQAPQVSMRPEVEVAHVVSIEEMMSRLGERLERALTLTFKDFVGSAEDRREIVVGFLAMLELVKRGILMAEQEQGGEIHMNYVGTTQVPRYD